MATDEAAYQTRGQGGPDFIQQVLDSIAYFDRVLGQIVMAQPYAVVPIFINEQLRGTGPYYSSSLDKLKPVVNALLAGKSGTGSSSGTGVLPSVQNSLGSVLSNLQGGVRGLAPITATAVGATGQYNYADMRPFGALTVFVGHTLDAGASGINITAEGGYDGAFTHVFPLDQDNNPFNVAQSTDGVTPVTDYETIVGDFMSFVRFKVAPVAAPTKGDFTLLVGMRR